MRVQKIQNNYNTSFCAKLKLSGFISDIKNETRQLWAKKAKDIGNDNDIITLHFGTFMKERGDVYKNGKFYPWTASFRAIYGSAQIDGEMVCKNKYIGYRVLNEPHSDELRDRQVCNFLDKLAVK